MINQRYGRIINIASVVGQNGGLWPSQLLGQQRAASSPSPRPSLWRWAKFNITANSIAPGFTSTEMVDAIPEEIAAQIKAKIPLGRFSDRRRKLPAPRHSLRPTVTISLGRN